MAVIEKERIEERYEVTETPAPKRRLGTAFTALAVIVLAAVAATVALVVTGGEPDTEAALAFRSQPPTLAELANQGLIPSEAVDWQALKTEQAVNQGFIPAETLEPYQAPVEPLFSESESLMIELAESGQIPMQAVDWEEVELKRLVNQGQIPRQALND